MLSSLKYHYSVASCFIRMSVQRQLEYPLFLVSWLLGVPLQWITGIFMIKVITMNFNSIGGWTFPQMAFIYGLGLLSHGIMVILFVQFWGISRMVVGGGFDRLLLRPMNVFFQMSVSFFNFIGFFDLIPGLIIFLYGCYAINFTWSPANIIKIFLVVFGGVLIRTAFYILTGSIAFWVKVSNSLVSLGQRLMQITTEYPLTIYPRLLQLILTFILPFGFISFYPACDFINQEHGFIFPLENALWTPVIGLIMFFITGRVFIFGLKHYEGSGS